MRAPKLSLPFIYLCGVSKPLVGHPMPTNLELKASYSSSSLARRMARGIGARSQGTMRQTDTYFKVSHGRLKLREINGKRLELIFYERDDKKGNRFSDYIVLGLNERDAAKKLLHSLFETLVVVKKRRDLFLYKNSRIHIDSVSGLGDFVEFEVLVVKGRRQARELMAFLRRKFGLETTSFIAGSYSDMMLDR